MEHGKRELLGAFLECRLELAALRERLGPAGRAAWVAEHLRDYVWRVGGALGVPGWSMADLPPESDTMEIVAIGTELLDSELRKGGLPESTLSRWAAFREQWEPLRAGAGGLAQAERLSALAVELHASLLELSRSGKSQGLPDAVG